MTSRTFVLVEEDATEPVTILGFESLNLCKLCELFTQLATKIAAVIASGVRLEGWPSKAIPAVGDWEASYWSRRWEKFIEIFNTEGGIGLFVDEKDPSARRYYEQFGFVSLPSNGLELFLPVKTIIEAVDSSG